MIKTVVFIVVSALTFMCYPPLLTIASEKPPILNNQHVVKQIKHNLLVDTAKWAMPAVSFFANKQAMINDFKIDVGTVVYWSKPFGSEVKILTPNDTSLYFTTQIELFNGPVTINIPPVHENGLRFFGTIMNAWQTPLEDVGPRGFDEGKGGKYFITPPNYQGEIPAGVIHRKSTTYNIVCGFRVTPKSFSASDLKTAADYGKTMRITLPDGSTSRFFDASGLAHNPLAPYGADYFRIIHHIINTEPMLPQDARFHDILAQFGISRNSKFKEIPEMKAAIETMKSDLRDVFRRDMGAKMFPGSNWQLPLDMSIEAASQFTYLAGSEYDWKRRALTFHWACWAPKYLGEATFYTVGQFDESGKVLDGGSTYKLNVPANVPAAQFWSATVYSMDTYAFYDNVPTVALNSLQDDLAVNKDGSTDIYFGPIQPKGVDPGNWAPTRAGSEFFLLFRWYGPKPELFNGSWVMGDITRQ